jgi:hypothetical protein
MSLWIIGSVKVIACLAEDRKRKVKKAKGLFSPVILNAKEHTASVPV